MKDYSGEWWFPIVCDDKYFSRLRDDYPDMAEESDEYLHAYYNGNRKYSITWDYIGEAYEEYEKLADAYFELLEELKKSAMHGT